MSASDLQARLAAIGAAAKARNPNGFVDHVGRRMKSERPEAPTPAARQPRWKRLGVDDFCVVAGGGASDPLARALERGDAAEAERIAAQAQLELQRDAGAGLLTVARARTCATAPRSTSNFSSRTCATSPTSATTR